MLLVLAAQRLRHRQAQPPLPDWDKTEGLSAILDYARRLPACDPADLEAGTGPFATLLREARQQRAQEGQGC
jgi:hypothetical protein